MAINVSRINQILITLFYGQLMSVAVYDLIIYGSNDLNYSKRDDRYFNIARIVIGAAMIICSVFSLVIIWLKKHKILFASGVFLSLILAAYVIIYTIYLSFNFKDLPTNTKYPLTVEFAIKAALMAIASFLTFFEASHGTYLFLNSTE
jgi:hypothetical protein